MAFQNLPYRQIWCIDTEFHAPDGHRPKPICLAGRELNSGKCVNQWLWGQGPQDPPFDIADDMLFVSYHTPAEWGVFLEMGWPLPRYSIDLCAEYKLITNRFRKEDEKAPKRGLIEALAYFDLPRLTKEAKSGYQDLGIRGGPYSADEQVSLRTYCQSDTDALPPLLECVLRRLRTRRKGISQAVQRGRECRPIAAIEHRGIPVDVDLAQRLKTHWGAIKAELVRRLDKNYGVYDGTKLRQDWLKRYAREHRIDWPRTPTGKLATKDKVLEELVVRYPELKDFKKLHYLLTKLKMAKITVDEHGRNRTMLGPFSAATSRNSYKAGQFLLVQAKWLRPLVKPPVGWAIASLDWKSQEIAVAAALSGCEAMLRLALESDPYVTFGRHIGLIDDPNATKVTHPAERKMAKECLLGSGYGMGKGTLSDRAEVSPGVAAELLWLQSVTFPEFTNWSRNVVDFAIQRGYCRTRHGWQVAVDADTRETSLKNFMIQSVGAEMMRVACCLAYERGVDIIAPLHDSIMIQAPAEDIHEAAKAMQACMDEASAAVLHGVVVGVEIEFAIYPQRYVVEPEDEAMWQQVLGILRDVEASGDKVQ
jgi:DNA polymerase I